MLPIDSQKVHLVVEEKISTYVLKYVTMTHKDTFLFQFCHSFCFSPPLLFCWSAEAVQSAISNRGMYARQFFWGGYPTTLGNDFALLDSTLDSCLSGKSISVPPKQSKSMSTSSKKYVLQQKKRTYVDDVRTYVRTYTTSEMSKFDQKSIKTMTYVHFLRKSCLLGNFFLHKWQVRHLLANFEKKPPLANLLDTV